MNIYINIIFINIIIRHINTKKQNTNICNEQDKYPSCAYDLNESDNIKLNKNKKNIVNESNTSNFDLKDKHDKIIKEEKQENTDGSNNVVADLSEIGRIKIRKNKKSYRHDKKAVDKKKNKPSFKFYKFRNILYDDIKLLLPKIKKKYFAFKKHKENVRRKKLL